jgi:autotransporter-associated beta strand protein
VDTSNPWTLNRLTVSAAGYTLGGNQLQLAGTAPSISFTSAIGTLTINNLVELAAASEVSVAVATRNVQLNGAVSGTGGLTKSGAGILECSAANSLTGSIAVNSGTLAAWQGGTFQQITGLTIGPGATWVNNYLSAGAGNNNRLPDTLPVTLRGGEFLQNAAWLTTTSETTGNFVLDRGFSTISGNYVGGQNRMTTLTMADLVRQNRSTVLVRGSNLGSGAAESVTVQSTAGISGLVGGGGGAGTTTISVLPYAIGGTSGNDLGSTLLTYGANGFRPLNTATEYATDLGAAGATENVRITAGATVNGAKTVNALVIAGHSITVSGTGALTPTSGVILGDANGSKTISKPVDFGSAEGLVYATENRGWFPFTLDGGLSGANGVTFSSPGAIQLSGINNYSGRTTVNAAEFRITATDAVPTGSVVFVADAARFLLLQGNQTVRGLSGNGNASSHYNAPSRTLTINTTGTGDSYDFAGQFAPTSVNDGNLHTSRNLNLVKTGPGTQAFSGNSSAWNGTATVSQGTLLVNGVLGDGTATVNVNGGTLGGTGTIYLAASKTCTVAQAAAVAPGVTTGATDIGTLTVNGAFDFQSNAVYHWQGNATTGDLVRVNGTLTLPAVATVNVKGSMPTPAILFAATALAGPGATDVSGWVVNGAAGVTVKVVGTTVQLLPPAGTVVMIR